MDKSSAQAIHELATTGRLSDETAEAVDKALGFEVDAESGLRVPKAEAKADDKADADAKAADKAEAKPSTAHK